MKALVGGWLGSRDSGAHNRHRLLRETEEAPVGLPPRPRQASAARRP